jgi:6-phosphogluconolactonase (cycloisomerase 2 family)
MRNRWAIPGAISAIAVVSLLLFSLTTQAFAVTTPRFAFVANSADNTVSIFTVNGTTGYLRHNGYVLTGSAPSGVAVTPSGAFLYVANSGSSNVSAFAVDLADGALTALTGSPFPAEAGPAAITATAKFVYVANKSSGTLSAYSINGSTGALTVVPGSPFKAGTSPEALGVNPSGKFLYVANSGSDNISGYEIATDGALTAISGSPFEAGATPVGLAITGSDDFVYVANSASNNVSAFRLNASTGVLTAVPGSPFKAGTKPSAVAVNPSSKFVYVTNSSSKNLSEFAISATTGALTTVSGSPVNAGSGPSTVAVDPSGKFLFAGNKTSADVSMFTLNGTTGALTSIVPGPARARLSPVSLVVTSGTTKITYTPTFVYTADFEGGVPTLAVSPSTGALTTVTGSPFGSGSPRVLALSPNGKFLYAANGDGTNTVGEYAVNAATGALTSIGTIATGNSPYAVAVDPSSRFVYAVAINTNAVYGYTIDSTTGALKAMAGSPFTTAIEAPDYVTVDPTGRFAMVAEGCCANTAGISVYTINPSTGELNAVPGSPFLPPTNISEPTGVAVDPTGRFVYVANGGGFGTLAVTVYSITASTGKLTLLGEPLPVGTGMVPESVATDVTGQYVYMTTNDDTLNGYSIDNTTGDLTELKGSPFSASGGTRGLAVDPSGKFLYLANGQQLLGYSINAVTGALTQLSTSPYTAGIFPLSLSLAGTIK